MTDLASSTLRVGWVTGALSDFVEPVSDRVKPADFPEHRFVGMDAVEAHTMKLLRTVPASTMKSSGVRFRPGQVLYGRLRPYLNKVLAPDFEGLASAEFICLQPKSGIHPRLIQYRLNSMDFVRFASRINEGDRPRVDFDQIAGFQIRLPPSAHQGALVECLDSYFSRLDGVEAGLKRVQRNLMRYRASVLQAAVTGRLVRTEAELARVENREFEPASDLLERILVERREKWKAEGQRGKYKEPQAPEGTSVLTLPEGWCWAAWGQIGFSQNGRAFPSKEYLDEGVRLLRPGNLHNSGRVQWKKSNTRHMPPRWAEDFPKFIVGGNELVMNLTAQSLRDEFLGRICLTSQGEHCLLNQRIARLTPVIANSRYLLWAFKSFVFRRFVTGLNTGSLIQHMFTSQLDRFALPLPPLSEQERIASEVDRYMTLADRIDQDLQLNLGRLPVLRQAELHVAFQGGLDRGNGEIARSRQS